MSDSINKNEIIKAEDIAIKRPGNGISPINYWDVIGTSASKDFNKDELIV